MRDCCPARAGYGAMTTSDLVSVRYASASEIVWGNFDGHAIAFQDADAKAAKLARDGREYSGSVVECHAERRARKNLGDGSLEFYQVFFGDMVL
jgi:hypothetical protein